MVVFLNNCDLIWSVLADPIQKLKDKLSERKTDSEIRDLNENFTVHEIFQVYVPIYEARLVGPKKKVEIMRVDAVKNKVI